jgi:hypothetical protein
MRELYDWIEQLRKQSKAFPNLDKGRETELKDLEIDTVFKYTSPGIYYNEECSAVLKEKGEDECEITTMDPDPSYSTTLDSDTPVKVFIEGPTSSDKALEYRYYYVDTDRDISMESLEFLIEVLKWDMDWLEGRFILRTDEGRKEFQDLAKDEVLDPGSWERAGNPSSSIFAHLNGKQSSFECEGFSHYLKGSVFYDEDENIGGVGLITGA